MPPYHVLEIISIGNLEVDFPIALDGKHFHDGESNRQIDMLANRPDYCSLIFALGIAMASQRRDSWEGMEMATRQRFHVSLLVLHTHGHASLSML